MSSLLLLVSIATFLVSSSLALSPHSRLRQEHGGPTEAEYLHQASALSSAGPSWTINVSQPLIHVSPTLYGIFFEEINNGGTGGLWAQQIQNSNFEDTRGIVAPWSAVKTGATYQLVLDEQRPINAANAVSLQVVTDMAAAEAGITNTGYWGINCSAGLMFEGSLHVRSATIKSVDVALVDAATGMEVYGNTSLAVAGEWSKRMFNLTCSQDGVAHFRVMWKTATKQDRINFDVVTLFPVKGWKGLKWMRPDLAQALADLKPAFVRFPGGCFVEGAIIANRWNWKKALGPLEARPGHWNLWGYWNEDGLGLLEFLEFLERMVDSYGNPTKAIWVVNNGISHDESISSEDIQPYIQDALDSLEYAMGPADSYWGAQRAEAGHPDPFSIWAVAIGNEDCGKPYYAANYELFYNQLSKAWPQVKLISNCDPTDPVIRGKETQLWDFHTYQPAYTLFSQSGTFDQPHWRKASNAKIFNSEYASVAPNSEWLPGNMQSAVGEAGWMNGLERNSDLVTIASYAPLFMRVGPPGWQWQPDAIMFNSSAWYGSPSYWNQQMYGSAFDGCVEGSVQSLSYTLDGAANVSVAVAVGTLTPAEQQARASNVVLVHKVASFNAVSVPLAIRLTNIPPNALLNTTLEVTYLASDDGQAKNTFEHPLAVSPMRTTVKVDGPSFTLTLAPNSIYIVRAYATV